MFLSLADMYDVRFACKKVKKYVLQMLREKLAGGELEAYNLRVKHEKRLEQLRSRFAPGIAAVQLGEELQTTAAQINKYLAKFAANPANAETIKKGK